ncbi:Cupredoxin [Colletotrichum navitas]|uniref:Cupredoxin n=1 Tax=Colletotrichum navitas TaxID=681940 RepID=A0AAD8Q1J4_9PEZI|nr:Cupredoxin [Colletotrichum navitas]KAK1593758.1 Cupredoxin [Colletotrichum navitas]
MHASTVLAAVLPAAAVMGATHVVKVGDGGLTFSPNDIKAAVGDLVEFQFYPKAHSVAQSAFDTPCTPLSNGTTTGFFSGPVPVTSGVGAMAWTLEIKDKSPKWFYCATGKHCQSGMVGVINAPAGGKKTVEMYAKAAAEAKENVAPSSTSGGMMGPASAADAPKSGGSGSASPSGSSGAPAASGSGMPSAGIEARGDVRWGLLSLGMAAAGLVGGLLV